MLHKGEQRKRDFLGDFIKDFTLLKQKKKVMYVITYGLPSIYVLPLLPNAYYQYIIVVIAGYCRLWIKTKTEHVLLYFFII